MNTKQLFAVSTPISARYGRASLRGGSVRCLAVAAAVAALAAAAPPAQAIYHNARVAEYLLQQHGAPYTHNARVAEYLLQQHRASGAQTSTAR